MEILDLTETITGIVIMEIHIPTHISITGMAIVAIMEMVMEIMATIITMDETNFF